MISTSVVRGVSAACAAWLVVAAASAEPVTEEPIRLVYRAPAGCPAEARFLDELAARTDRARVARAGEPARLFSVVVESDGRSAHGVLETTDLAGVTSTRDVSGDECAEVVSALALIAALAVDPEARTDPAVTRSPSSPEPVPSSAAPSASAPILAPTVSAPSAPPVVVVPAVRALRTPSAPRETSSSAAGRWSLGVEGSALGGLTSALAPGGGVFVDLATENTAVFSPSFRVMPWFATTRDSFDGGVGARLTWFVARVEGCPARPGLSRSLRLETCLAFDVGVMHTAGFGVEHPDTDDKAWLAPSALGRLAWSMSQSLRGEASLGAVVPLRRYPFEFDAGTSAGPTTLGRLGPVGALLSLGVRYVLP